MTDHPSRQRAVPSVSVASYASQASAHAPSL